MARPKGYVVSEETKLKIAATKARKSYGAVLEGAPEVITFTAPNGVEVSGTTVYEILENHRDLFAVEDMREPLYKSSAYRGLYGLSSKGKDDNFFLKSWKGWTLKTRKTTGQLTWKLTNMVVGVMKDSKRLLNLLLNNEEIIMCHPLEFVFNDDRWSLRVRQYLPVGGGLVGEKLIPIDDIADAEEVKQSVAKKTVEKSTIIKEPTKEVPPKEPSWTQEEKRVVRVAQASPEVWPPCHLPDLRIPMFHPNGDLVPSKVSITQLDEVDRKIAELQRQRDFILQQKRMQVLLDVRRLICEYGFTAGELGVK